MCMHACYFLAKYMEGKAKPHAVRYKVGGQLAHIPLSPANNKHWLVAWQPLKKNPAGQLITSSHYIIGLSNHVKPYLEH